MTLRSAPRKQQLLSSLGSALLLCCAAVAQDVVITTDNQQRQVKVVGVSPSGTSLEFLVGAGKLGLPLASVREVRMAPPPEFNAAIQAYQARDYAKALVQAKAVVDRFRGMPAPWAQQATAMIGELYIAMDDLPKAEAAYAAFQKAYPAGGSVQSEIGLARLAVAKKDLATAKTKLGPVIDAALKEANPGGPNGLAYSQAFVVSGELKQAEGDFSGALEDYLRTVTLYFHDRASASLAQQRADALRKAHPEIAVP